MIIEMPEFQVTLSRKKIKNINLRINALGEVKVSVPQRLSLSVVQRFLHEKSDWVVSRRKQINAVPKPLSPQLVTGECHFFLGEPYTLIVHQNSKENDFSIEGTTMQCFCKAGDDVNARYFLLQNWYRQKLHQLLPDLIKKWELVIGVKAKSWGIKAMKTRWGSCNPSTKTICINLHLIQKPLNCLEMVIVHELIHLLEPSHNERFYALMSQFMPDWKSYKNQLKQPMH